ncbi:MAG TPA: hypothetical protein VMJ64_02630, partial [Anaerolineales bacterium]|nr:hypothetical protein [Anaerolineales bacterium]
ALTSLAMYATGWGYTETPATLNLKLKSAGGFVNEAIVWGAITKFHPQIQNKGLTLCMDTEAPLALIDGYLAAGEPVIVEVDYSPAAGLQSHWVLVYARQNGDYLIQDPWPSPPETGPITLLSRFAQGRPLAHAIKAVAWYQTGATVPVPAPSPSSPTVPITPAPLPAPVETDLVLQVVPTATAGIKLHDTPVSGSLASYAEMPGVPLSVIEDKAGALSKLGHMNQWIFVRDPNGHQGFVAAWYMEVASSPSTPPPPAPSTPAPVPPSPGSPLGAPERFQVVVIPTVGAAGLAVRQQPSLGADKVNDEKAGARLTVIEPAATAMPKIGQAGQWLAVKATNNQRGYVMAQYVQLRQ